MHSYKPSNRGGRNSLWLIGAAGLTALFVLIAALRVEIEGSRLVEKQLRDRLKTTAGISAMLFTGEEIDEIRSQSDVTKPLFVDIVNRLATARAQTNEIEYAYIMRRTDHPDFLEFVADADSLDSFEEADADNSGSIDPDEELSYPGDSYYIADIPALQGQAFVEPSVDTEITEDQWGSFISAYAPIRRIDGSVAGIIGLDMRAEYFDALQETALSSITLHFFIKLAVVAAVFLVFFAWKSQLDTLRQIDAERHELLRLVSHQLGAPLATMRWWLEILKEDLGKDDKGKEAFEQMAEGIERFGRIMKTLRDMVENADRRRAYQAEVADMEELIREVVQAYRKKADRRGQIIEMELADMPPMSIDAKLVGGVLEELVDNAIDYSADNSKIVVESKVSSSFVTVSVHDKGIGIPKEDMKRIFREFVRGSNAESKKPTGNGFGLAIAKSIIERGGGEMWVQSTEGEGSTFSFSLPIA